MTLIACLGWDSLVWDPRGLPIQRKWFDDGPFVKVELCANRRTVASLWCSRPQPLHRAPFWAIMDSFEIDAAKEALQKREGCGATDIAGWATGEIAPAHVIGLPQWAEAHGVDSVVWTALPPKFSGHNARVPTVEEVLYHLSGLSGTVRDLAERYVRLTPRQIDTPYSRRIEAALNWTPIVASEPK